MIYFAHDQIGGFVKIGFSLKPGARLNKMRTDSPRELVLLGVVDGDLSVERAFHDRFAHLRHRGEWFKDDGTIVALVEAMILSGQAQPTPPKKVKPSTNGRPSNSQLTALGLSRSYASELVKGKKLPSLLVAQRIEAALGYPASAWRLETAA